MLAKSGGFFGGESAGPHKIKLLLWSGLSFRVKFQM